MELPAKDAVFAAIDAELTRQIAEATRLARVAAESAVHEESRSEDQHDTRATEASYLARGQAQRVADLELDQATLRSLQRHDFSNGRPIASSALVALEDEDENVLVVLLAPAAGGVGVTVDGVKIRVVSPGAPLSEALLGKEVDDDVDVPGRTQEYVVLAVS